MSSVNTDPTIPFHISRTYGVTPIARVRPMPAADAARLEPDAFRLEPDSKTPTPVSRLIAGVVPGGIEFDGMTPRPSGNSLPFYRHPADQHAAATNLATGRLVDVTG